MDDQLVYEQRTIPGPGVTVYRYGGWRKKGAETIEAVLPMLRVETGKLRVVYTEPDGHANWTVGTVNGQPDTDHLMELVYPDHEESH